jgi:predicted DNA-binding protein with PD1-like motif
MGRLASTSVFLFARVTLMRAPDGEVLGTTGHYGRNSGQFHHVHEVVSDSDGNLYTGEVETGKRVQKFARVRGNPAR